MKKPVEKLLKTHKNLVHSDQRKVISHVQRYDGEWFINTIMIEGCDVPFKYKRQEQYKNLNGQRINLTYYASTETVAGFKMEIMKVVRIKVS